VQCHYDSVHGRIESNWSTHGDMLVLDVTVPANTTATVYMPTDSAGTVLENGKPLKQVDGVRLLRSEAGRTVLACTAGVYKFTAALPVREMAKTVDQATPPAKPR
jgi:alpha-L-rhamnosidase